MNQLDQFKQTYITECFELLSDMEERLLNLDTDAVDNEALNAIFRCAHSIKGGSGAFGFDYITEFTHALETLLDAMREGKVYPTRESVDILLKAVDVVSQMVQCARDNTRPSADLGQDIKARLMTIAKSPTKPPVVKEEYGFFDNEENTSRKPVGMSVWLIEFTPHETLLNSGNEPLLILRELARLGNVSFDTNIKRVPNLESIHPTSCYLSFSVTLETERQEADIKEVFEFVTEHCNLKITLKQSPSESENDGKNIKSLHEVPTIQDKSVLDKTVNATNKINTSEKDKEQPQKGTTATTSIRVDLEKVDRLVNIIGELVITEAMLRAQMKNFTSEDSLGLMRGIDELSHHTRELQEAVMTVRMQPVKSVFSRMPRIVRDISTQLGKDIKLIMSGENTEVDKTVIEQLSDPLMHMIRNSCDHGIETPDVRAKKGKPEQGVIYLSAHHRGGRILIEIRDDGAGINRERVLAKAREKGLLPIDLTPSDDDIDNIIFMPGFSTAEKVTNVSGRGVGMDVVKRNIEAMGGHVRVTNDPGQGSLFTVSLPLTLAILDGMIVRVGAENYIIPITSIIETLRPKSGEVRRVEGHSDVINVRGEFVSLIYLYRVFNILKAEHDPSRGLVVLVESGQQKMGLVVDELIGQQQVVIKSLEANSDPVLGISGATILGDGRVSLILEIGDLAQVDLASKKHTKQRKAA